MYPPALVKMILIQVVIPVDDSDTMPSRYANSNKHHVAGLRVTERVGATIRASPPVKTQLFGSKSSSGSVSFSGKDGESFAVGGSSCGRNSPPFRTGSDQVKFGSTDLSPQSRNPYRRCSRQRCADMKALRAFRSSMILFCPVLLPKITGMAPSAASNATCSRSMTSDSPWRRACQCQGVRQVGEHLRQGQLRWRFRGALLALARTPAPPLRLGRLRRLRGRSLAPFNRRRIA